MVISHDIASAFNVADRLAVLYDGHLVAEGTPTEIRASEHPFVKKFLSTWFEKQ
jgi:phospholipid/cholesterol/gamma-HCH transport system ATP-binding protein